MSEEVSESLSEILSKGPAAAATPTDVKPTDKPVEAAPSAVEPDKGQTRDESGKFKAAEKEPEKAVDKQADKPVEKPRADVAAIIDERRKRQAAEARLKELETAKPTPKPSVFENEDAAISSRVEEALRPMREAIYQQSVRLARTAYKDAYGEAEQAFIEAAEKDERLITGLRQSSDPGEFIYSMGIQMKELSDVGGDFMKYREKITSGMQGKMTELETQNAALKAQVDALTKTQADLDNLPTSLNNRSSGAQPKAGEGDSEDITSIVRFGTRKP